jgi:hypothetical protein
MLNLEFIKIFRVLPYDAKMLQFVRVILTSLCADIENVDIIDETYLKLHLSG